MDILNILEQGKTKNIYVLIGNGYRREYVEENWKKTKKGNRSSPIHVNQSTKVLRIQNQKCWNS